LVKARASRRKTGALAERRNSKAQIGEKLHQNTTTTTLTSSKTKNPNPESEIIMRTNNDNTNNAQSNRTKQLFNELKSVTESRKAAGEPICPPPMPARAAAKVAPAPAETNGAALLRQLHRIVCNQAWSLRHVQEPVVQHRIVVGAKAKQPATRATKKVMCASAAREFPFRHVEPRVKTSPVVGVREAWSRLTMRAISRGEFELKSRKSARPLAAIIPTGPVQLNHVQTRVTTTPIVGVRDGWTRLALRAISRSEFSLKPAPETRVTNAVVVLATDKKKPASESNAAILRRNAPLLAQLANSGADAFEAVRLFASLDENSRKLVVALLNL
jgi:hypothetical protein